jgi:hypothetical protein
VAGAQAEYGWVVKAAFVQCSCAQRCLPALWLYADAFSYFLISTLVHHPLQALLLVSSACKSLCAPQHCVLYCAAAVWCTAWLN